MMPRARCWPNLAVLALLFAPFAPGPVLADAPDGIESLEALARTSVEMGLPDDAAAAYERALALRHDLGQDDTDRAATTMERLAEILQPLERTERAEALLRQALELRETLHGPESPKVQALLGRLSKLIQQARPDDEEAGELLLRRIELADSYALRRQVGQYFSETGDHEQARVHFHEALVLAERDPRNGIYWRGPAAANLAREYEASGEFGLAETYLVRALEASELQYGPRHPYLAWALRNLGEFYVEHERFVEAALHLERALEFKQLAYGQCDVCNRDVVSLLRQARSELGIEDDLCSTEESVEADAEPPEPESLEARQTEMDERTGGMIQRREFARARETALQSLGLREEAFGVDSLEAAESLDMLVRIARKSKRNEEQFALLERYLLALEQQLPADTDRIAAALHALGQVAQKDKEPAVALEQFQREIYLREAAGQNLALARTLNEMGRIHRELGDERQAGGCFMRAADAWERMAGPHAAEYVRNRLALSESYLALGLIDDTESALLELLRQEERRDVARPDLLEQVLKPLQALYADSGRNDEAEAVRLRLDALERAKRAAR
jgi:tetratricopeptide (TPR) repeat protein